MKKCICKRTLYEIIPPIAFWPRPARWLSIYSAFRPFSGTKVSIVPFPLVVCSPWSAPNLGHIKCTHSRRPRMLMFPTRVGSQYFQTAVCTSTRQTMHRSNQWPIYSSTTIKWDRVVKSWYNHFVPLQKETASLKCCVKVLSPVTLLAWVCNGIQ